MLWRVALGWMIVCAGFVGNTTAGPGCDVAGVDAVRCVVDLGPWDEQGLSHLITEAGKVADIGTRIGMISEAFLGMPYEGHPLIGDAETPEQFVVYLSGVDCVTFVDYVVALAYARDLDGFYNVLRRMRYRDGHVSFLNRNHFFTQWISRNPEVVDVTDRVGPVAAVEKRLNDRGDGRRWLEGLPVDHRTVRYIPRDQVDGEVLGRLKTGQVVGFYTSLAGLDVTHVGVLVRKEKGIAVRHASTKGTVREDDLRTYLAEHPRVGGIMVAQLRGPLAP